jgi:hypothetical protein
MLKGCAWPSPLFVEQGLPKEQVEAIADQLTGLRFRKLAPDECNCPLMLQPMRAQCGVMADYVTFDAARGRLLALFAFFLLTGGAGRGRSVTKA